MSYIGEYGGRSAGWVTAETGRVSIGMVVPTGLWTGIYDGSLSGISERRLLARSVSTAEVSQEFYAAAGNAALNLGCEVSNTSPAEWRPAAYFAFEFSGLEGASKSWTLAEGAIQFHHEGILRWTNFPTTFEITEKGALGVRIGS